VWVLSALPLTAQPLDPTTHGRGAEPDYARVFPQDRVSRIDLQVTAADWQQLMDDMTGMAGAFGAGAPAAAAGQQAEGGGGDDVELLPQTPVYIPATVTFDGITFPMVGLRLKGNSTLLE
jgi:spore coat protein H